MVLQRVGAELPLPHEHELGRIRQHPGSHPLQVCPLGLRELHREQELAMPRCKKSRKDGKRHEWISWDLLVKLKDKKEMQRQWEQRLISWEGYRDTA